MLKKILTNIKKMILSDIFTKVYLEIVFFIGISFVVYTNFKINTNFGMYSIGILLIAYSIYSLKS